MGPFPDVQGVVSAGMLPDRHVSGDVPTSPRPLIHPTIYWTFVPTCPLRQMELYIRTQKYIASPVLPQRYNPNFILH